MCTINSKPGHYLEVLTEKFALEQRLEDTKLEFRAKFEYLEAILLEREEELRENEEKRYYAEDVNI